MRFGRSFNVKILRPLKRKYMKKLYQWIISKMYKEQVGEELSDIDENEGSLMKMRLGTPIEPTD